MTKATVTATLLLTAALLAGCTDDGPEGTGAVGVQEGRTFADDAAQAANPLPAAGTHDESRGPETPAPSIWGPNRAGCEQSGGRPPKCQENATPYNMSGCDLFTTAIRIDIETARASLPAGYEAQDGGHMLGLSNTNPNLMGTGKAVLPIAGLNCRDLDTAGGPTSFGFAWIDIEPPRVGNRTSPSTEHDAYDVLQFASNGDHADLLESFQLDVRSVDVSMDFANTGAQGLAVAVGTLEIVGADGPLVTIEAVGAGASDIGGVSLASWHQVDEGVSLMSLHATSADFSEAIVTKPTTCQLAEGSLLAHLVGDTDCTVAAANGLLVTGADISGTLEFMRGAQAEEES